ncbi:MAG: redoxin domain-containing protein [Gammaproteobacteria bacterium]|nr:redoxin domain-containing protein [Gammaproteobacteria bacterium]
MKRLSILILSSLAVILTVLPLTQAARGGIVRQPLAAPEFTHAEPGEWLNSTPLKLADLRGKVVLVDFWTFECWNCYRSFPWLKSVEARLKDKGLRVIGVHSPEFERERVPESIGKKIKEFGLEHPVMIDNDFSYWKAMANRYWPAYFLIDKKGLIRAAFAGETHEGDSQAREIEKIIGDLLAES